jgi:glycosyltransferase involved in cell wall biosynthesis
VIASPTGAIPDLIQDGQDGFLVDPKDVKDLANKMTFFCEQKAQIHFMARHVRKKAETAYSFRNMRSIYERIYASACSQDNLILPQKTGPLEVPNL